MRTARASATSTTIPPAAGGPSTKVTMQSSHAEVPCSTQSSQLMDTLSVGTAPPPDPAHRQRRPAVEPRGGRRVKDHGSDDAGRMYQARQATGVRRSTEIGARRGLRPSDCLSTRRTGREAPGGPDMAQLVERSARRGTQLKDRGSTTSDRPVAAQANLRKNRRCPDDNNWGAATVPLPHSGLH